MIPGVPSFCAVAAELGRSLTDMDDVGSMDEIQMLPEETDGEYTKMAGEMTSLEGMQEDEANEDDDEDADDDM